MTVDWTSIKIFYDILNNDVIEEGTKLLLCLYIVDWLNFIEKI